ncbi:hypothetical protein H6798_00820 [Candidatus Nomurabacteria bacterium]|nr:hypothetical protein [Candidatus Nomurabacteria bacterium]
MQSTKYFILSTCLALLFFSRSSAAATTLEGLTVSPAIIDAPVDNKSIDKDIRLTNLYRQAVAVEIYTRSLNPEDSIIPNSTYIDARELIGVSEKQLILEPGQSRTVSILIDGQKIPGGVGSYAAVVFKVSGYESLSSSGVTVNTEISVPVLISSKGEVKHDLRVSLAKPPILVFGKFSERTILIENSGTIHERPIVNLEVLGPDDRVITSESRIEDLLLPGTVRKITWLPPDQLESGRYKLSVRLTYANQLQAISKTNTVIKLPSFFSIVGLVLVSILMVKILKPILPRDNLRKKLKQSRIKRK